MNFIRSVEYGDFIHIQMDKKNSPEKRQTVYCTHDYIFTLVSSKMEINIYSCPNLFDFRANRIFV